MSKFVNNLYSQMLEAEIAFNSRTNRLRNQLGEELKRAREVRGLTPKEFAWRSGLSARVLHNIERGARIINGFERDKITQTLAAQGKQEGQG